MTEEAGKSDASFTAAAAVDSAPLSERTPEGSVLCALDDLSDPGAKGVLVADDDGFPLKVFLVCKDTGVYGYVNSCPHNRIPLDFKPDEFLDLSHSFIQCATHGAIFRIHDGYCFEGPCLGQSLTPFPVTVRDGSVVVGPYA